VVVGGRDEDVTRHDRTFVIDFDDAQPGVRLKQLGKESRRVRAAVLHDDER
jgi:hypothetical protein